MTTAPDALHIAQAPRRDSATWTQGTITWNELLEWAHHPRRTKACGNYVLGRLRGTRRTKTSILSRDALTLDADNARGTEIPDALALLGVRALVHATFSSTAQAPRYRVIIPLSRPVLPDEYVHAATRMLEMLGADQFDPGSIEPERYMFRPATSSPDDYRVFAYDGPPQDAEDLLSDFDSDLSSRPTPRTRKRDPLGLEGTPGAFNRAYSIAEAIEAFELPYEAAGADSWHLVGARAAAGVNMVAPGLVYSHHVTDPAHGQAQSAFDLVRIHRFGEMDEDAPPGTPINRLPSHDAMCELVMGDARVLRQLVGEDFAQELDEVAQGVEQEVDEESWLLRLVRTPRTGAVRDCAENWELLQAHDPVLRSIYRDELKMGTMVDTPPPWRTPGQTAPEFGAADRLELVYYLLRQYRLDLSPTRAESWALMRAFRNVRNPLRERLEALRWDGVPRLETCLPGVAPTPYTRLVARRALCAAVARMMNPGCKWDHTLVLYGDEGLGKTFWMYRMAMGHLANLGSPAHKDTLLTASRSWIMVSDEGHSLRKADADAVKEFLTRTSDVYRVPFEKETLEHPRHWVVWGSTNDKTFLRRQQGNRRFLVVHCEQPVDFDALTDEYVEQVWAEAVHLWRQGEPLHMDKEEADMAADAREAFTEEDAVAGMALEYLSTLVPEDWGTRSEEDRHRWLLERPDYDPGVQPIMEVCSAQLWVEALGRRRGDARKVDLRELTEVLHRLPGWRQADRMKRLPGYGPQRYFVRTDDGTDAGWDLL